MVLIDMSKAPALSYFLICLKNYLHRENLFEVDNKKLMKIKQEFFV